MRSRFLLLAFALCCREPTQVTLEISTDAACASEPLAPLMLVETLVVAGEPTQVREPSVAANTSTSACEGGEIGSIVLYPDGGATTAGVLVIGRLHADGGAPTEEDCLAFANPAPGAAPVDGSACIVARRQVEFVDHKPLRLPIRLSVACAGFVCGPEETCIADGLGPRCVSAVVGCDTKGDCDAQGGGGVGGAGAAGAGGAGGTGGGEGGGPVEATVTPIVNAENVPFTHVAGFDPPGKVMALHLDDMGMGFLYEVNGDTASQFTSLGNNVTTTSSYRMRATVAGGKSVIAWDYSGLVASYSDSFSSVFSPNGPLRDFVMTDEDSFLFVGGQGNQVSAQDANGAPTMVCPTLSSGPTNAMAFGGGAIFTGGSLVCSCSACQPIAGGAEAVDIAAHPTTPLAVAVWAQGVAAFQNDVITTERVLLDEPTQGQLGFVHVTPTGAVWVAASVAGAQGASVARGAVDSEGKLSAAWSRAFVPEVAGGAISLWATDTPAPAAYVIDKEGRLFRLEGL